MDLLILMNVVAVGSPNVTVSDGMKKHPFEMTVSKLMSM